MELDKITKRAQEFMAETLQLTTGMTKLDLKPNSKQKQKRGGKSPRHKKNASQITQIAFRTLPTSFKLVSTAR